MKKVMLFGVLVFVCATMVAQTNTQPIDCDGAALLATQMERVWQTGADRLYAGNYVILIGRHKPNGKSEEPVLVFLGNGKRYSVPGILFFRNIHKSDDYYDNLTSTGYEFTVEFPGKYPGCMYWIVQGDERADHSLGEVIELLRAAKP